MDFSLHWDKSKQISWRLYLAAVHHFCSKLCNQVHSLDHFVVQNFGDFLCWKYKEVECFYVSNLLQLRRVLWISAEQTIGAGLKHENTQPLYIFSRVRVLHLNRLKEQTWLHSFAFVWPRGSKKLVTTASSKEWNAIWRYFTLLILCLALLFFMYLN